MISSPHVLASVFTSDATAPCSAHPYLKLFSNVYNLTCTTCRTIHTDVSDYIGTTYLRLLTGTAPMRQRFLTSYKVFVTYLTSKIAAHGATYFGARYFDNVDFARTLIPHLGTCDFVISVADWVAQVAFNKRGWVDALFHGIGLGWVSPMPIVERSWSRWLRRGRDVSRYVLSRCAGTRYTETA